MTNETYVNARVREIEAFEAMARGEVPHHRKRNSKGQFVGGWNDDITPVSRNDTNWPHNLQLLCMLCNRKKHAKDPVAHAREIGLLPSRTAATAADVAQQKQQH